MDKRFIFALSVVLNVLAVAFSGGLAMAATTIGDLEPTGNTEPGSGTLDTTPTGIATETVHKQVDEKGIAEYIDSKVLRMHPQLTPVDTISRNAPKQKVDSFVVRVYDIGTKPILTKLKAPVTAQASGTLQVIDVENTSMFTQDDTILVPGVKALYDKDGKKYEDGDPTRPDLMLCVASIDPNTGKPSVFAVNGNLDGDNSPIWVPELKQGQQLLRMSKSVSEVDSQTGRFANYPKSIEQYCQNTMIQVESSKIWDKVKKNVDWNFSDQEEDAVLDMRMTNELTLLFGSPSIIRHQNKDNMNQYFTKGIWYQAAKDITIGKFEAGTNTTTISEYDFVDLTKDLFVGANTGSKEKLIFCGSEFMAAISKVKLDKNMYVRENPEISNLKFRRIETNFGNLNIMHHTLFDSAGKSDSAFVLDPNFLKKYVFMPWSRKVLDLDTAGVRNVKAVRLQEIACLVLRYPTAHARVSLAKE